MDKTGQGALRRWGRGAVLIATGAVAGGALAWTLTAGAATTPSPTGSYAASPAPWAGPDESTSRRPDEQLLSGDTATRVREAALAKYPGASVLRVETDSNGGYEAHLRTAGGQPVTVEVGKDFTVTGEEAAPAGRAGGCRPGGVDYPRRAVSSSLGSPTR